MDKIQKLLKSKNDIDRSKWIENLLKCIDILYSNQHNLVDSKESRHALNQIYLWIRNPPIQEEYEIYNVIFPSYKTNFIHF